MDPGEDSPSGRERSLLARHCKGRHCYDTVVRSKCAVRYKGQFESVFRVSAFAGGWWWTQR